MLLLGAVVVACGSEPEVVEKVVEVEKEVPVEVIKEVEVVREVEKTAGGWEVWLSDQSDSADISADHPSGSYGSRIVVYEGSDILAAAPGWYAEDDPEYAPTVIEATDVFPAAFEELGVQVRRLHGMLMHPPTHRYVGANFFGPGAGLVGIIDAEGQCTRSDGDLLECQSIQGDPQEAEKLGKALFRTTGPEGASPSNHMSFFTADGSKLIVGNLAAKLLERIDYDAETDTFTFNKAATLDLVGGRDLTVMAAQADSTLPGGRVSGEYANFQPTTTPSGALKEGPGRTNNVVVCPIPSSDNQHAYVTFDGGGLFVVDITTEPMSIVAEYTNDVISVAGCGGVEAGGFMHLNAGVSASDAGADDSTFILYRLPLDYPDGANPHTTPNTPAVVKFYEDKILDITDEADLAARRDAHGMTVSANARYLYAFDRTQNKAEVFDMGKIVNDPAATLREQETAHTGTVELTGSGYCVGDAAPFVDMNDREYELNDDPAPDLVDITPDGRMIVVAFRGSNPITVKHAALGSCPGFGVVTLSDDGGSTGTLTHVFRTLLPDATGTRNLSDIHAAAIRVKSKNSENGDDSVTDSAAGTVAYSLEPGVADQASADMIAPDGSGIGSVQFQQGPTGVLMKIDVAGLEPGPHGIHLHSMGACTPDFKAAGGHINPNGGLHGLLNEERSESSQDNGDLPNLYVGDDGTAQAEFFTSLVTIAGGSMPALLDSDGSTVVIHENPDDHTSQPIGGAGGRVGCGIIR